MHNHHDIILNETDCGNNTENKPELNEKENKEVNEIKKAPQWSTVYGLLVGDCVHNFIATVTIIIENNLYYIIYILFCITDW